MIKDNKDDSDRSTSTGSWVDFSSNINWFTTREREAVPDPPSSIEENQDKTKKKLKKQEEDKEEKGIFAAKISSIRRTRKNLVDEGDWQPSLGRRPVESPFAKIDEEQGCKDVFYSRKQDAVTVRDAASTPNVAAMELMRGEHYVRSGTIRVPGPGRDQDEESHDDVDHEPGAHPVTGTVASSAEGVAMPEIVTSFQEPDSVNLVSAQLVDTEEEARRIQQLEELLQEREETVAVAHVVSKGEILKSFFNLRDPEFRRQRICGFGFLMIVLAAIVISVVLTRDDDDPTAIRTPPPTPLPTPEPTTPVHKKLSEFLSEISFDDGAALFNQSTPQYQAVKWLANDTSITNIENIENIDNIDPHKKMQIVQRYALATLYFSTNGDNWTKNDRWLDKGTECGRWWQAEATTNLLCKEQDEVKFIDLERNKLKGTIPPELAFLSNSLELISLRENDMTGTIPTELALLTMLSTLKVNQNKLNVTIMTELGLMTNLDNLLMVQNEFTGTIATELFLLTNLLTLTLGGGLQGMISTDIGALTKLTLLDLYENELSGTIPSTIGLLSSLVHLYLESNSLVGKIPSEIQNLTKLKVLWLLFNSLSGTVPSTIGLQTNLEELFLNGNSFTGSIPSELGALSSVDILALGENSLIGTIPSELGLLTSTTMFALNGNSLTGHIPNEIGGLTNLNFLSLTRNELTGTIPSGINNMTSLATLWLYGNNLTGPFTCPTHVKDCQISCESDSETCRVL